MHMRRSTLESVALHSIMTACILLLQKLHFSSKCRDHINALDRRLKSWQDGDIKDLLREGRTIQHAMGSHCRRKDWTMDERENEEGWNARIFAKLMFEGKIHSALRHISENHRGEVLSLDERMDPLNDQSPTVRQVLHEKHPDAH